jgi:hypothetical protein
MRNESTAVAHTNLVPSRTFFDENESNTKPYIQLNLGNVAMFGHYVGFTDEPVARCMCVLADDPAEDAK